MIVCIYQYIYVMNTIQKLKQSLQQSLNWGKSFKQQIKKMLQQISTKTSQICQLRRQSIFFNDEINKCQSQLKGLLEEKQKSQYKKDKIQIKLDEITSRMSIYESSIKKKNQWNKQLRKKLEEIQGRIEEKSREGDWEDMFDDMSESHLSVKSAVSSKSSQMQSRCRDRSELTVSKIDLKLQRLRKLQVQYMQQTSKCKHKQQEYQRLKKVGERLRQKLREQTSQSNCNKQNIGNNSVQTVEQISKQTKGYMLKLKQLEEKHSETVESLEEQRRWINSYAKYIDQIVQSQKSMEVYRNQVAQIDRQSKKDKKTFDTILNYILNQ